MAARRSQRGRGGFAAKGGPASARRAASASSDAAAELEADPEAVARQICLRLLTVAPRTQAQLADALRRRGVPDDAAAAVLTRFAEVKLIDDAMFARAWVDSRHHGRGLASRALGAELRQRGVPQDDIQAALSQRRMNARDAQRLGTHGSAAIARTDIGRRTDETGGPCCESHQANLRLRTRAGSFAKPAKRSLGSSGSGMRSMRWPPSGCSVFKRCK